jgi:hypothetical protein
MHIAVRGRLDLGDTTEIEPGVTITWRDADTLVIESDIFFTVRGVVAFNAVTYFICDCAGDEPMTARRRGVPSMTSCVFEMQGSQASRNMKHFVVTRRIERRALLGGAAQVFHTAGSAQAGARPSRCPLARCGARDAVRP